MASGLLVRVKTGTSAGLYVVWSSARFEDCVVNRCHAVSPEIELSHICVNTIALDESTLKVTIKLPTSKTDPTGTDASRS